MPGIGPSLVFAAGLAVGVGAGSLIPKKSTKEIGVLPPPPVEKYDVVKRLPTATGSVVLQGGFPGTSSSILASRNRADKKDQHPISSKG
jgi:endonuclease G